MTSDHTPGAGAVTGAVERAESGPTATIQRYEQDFATMLPSHIKPEAWVRLAIGVFRRSPQLQRAATQNPASMMAALLDAARQGLEPGTPQYYLVPRKSKTTGLEVQGIRGYQGEIELIYRAGAVSSVIVEVVRERDVFSYRPGRDERPLHDIDWDADDRGPLRLVYAYAIMRDGATSKVVVLNKTAIAKIRAKSEGADGEYSPWRHWEEAMWLKSAVHQLQKWVPTSAEYIREQLRAVRDVAAEGAQPRPVPDHPLPPEQHGDEETDDGRLDADDGVLDAEVVNGGATS